MTRILFGKLLKTCLLVSVLVTSTVFFSQILLARESVDDSSRLQRYMIELLDPPLAAYDGGDLSIEGDRGPKRMAATAPEFSGDSRLDAHAPASLAYLGFLAERHAEFTAEVSMLLGRQPAVAHRYRAATNGLALDLTAAEAAILAESPLVKSIEHDVVYKLDTYAGPNWLGAAEIWNGDAGFPAARGEGIIIGNIDTGINWDHPSFADTGHLYVNPYGSGLDLCSDAEVNCNNKLVGVYDFVVDDPSTEDWVEENTKGKDNNGHGSHTASTAAGTPVNVDINEAIDTTVSGVAPHASIVSYRVCYMGEPHSDESDGCSGTAITSAIDQAVLDGVDVINYSIGGDARNPWTNTHDQAFLNARGAGIFIASSAGNTGPDASSITSPALAPWVVAVGNATHNRILGSVVQNFSGGSLPAPDDMVGASLTEGTGKLVVVHAKDYGFALCGTGETQSERTCEANTGATNPWAGSRPFNGEIVVCDRGIYGRVEKGKNLQQAGAGGYILANTAEWGETIVADDHCLPATHIGYEDGEDLRTWLDAGVGHGAQLSGLMLAEIDSQADLLSDSSSRGPAVEPVQDTLKPNVIAPGTGILAAGYQGSTFLTLSGTSMASPHVAGAAALLKSVHTDWSANQLASAIEMTATQELGKNENGGPATTQEIGAGRPRLGEAVNAGLFMDVSSTDFRLANPSLNGEPRDLNLPGVVSSVCDGMCTFSRTVTDMKGGGSWSVTPVDFPPGTQVTVTPSSFNLGNMASRELSIEVDVANSGSIAGWVSGKIMLSSAGSPDQYLTVSVYVHEQWSISTDQDGGWTEFDLKNTVELPDATFTAGKPAKKEIRTLSLVQDPTNSDPYDGGEGVFTHLYTLPQGAMWLFAETLSSTAEDIDLFVGRDDNQNGQAEASEELCSSHTPEELERCDLYDLSPGTYWILVQNWSGNLVQGNTVELLHVAIEPSGDGSMAASGPGIVHENEPFQVRVSWDNFAGLPGETWLSAVGVGSHKNSPYNIGLIPVDISRSGFAAAETFPLMDGRTHGLALGANGNHDRMFIDVPPGASSLTVSASGASDEQSNALALELVRQDFDDGMSNPPFASPAGNGLVEASASGSNGTGPTATISGGVEPGRWYAVLRNTTGTPVSVEVSADVEFQGTAIDVHPGLWHPGSRPGLGQGYDYSWGGDSRALIWYTYDEDGLPAWFISGAPANDGNIWTTDILRVTNDGATQQLAPVGSLSVTALARDDAMFSYTLYGKSGTERMIPLSGLTCPDVNGSPASYTGIWFRGVDGLGGASVLVNSTTQAQIHYLFDSDGLPRWLFAQDPDNADPHDPEIPMLQFTGFCAVCNADTVSYEVVGTLGRSFSSETDGSWTQDYTFIAPPNGNMERTDQVVKLTQRLDCQ